ncbi:MAG: thiamine pyrophosphate-binding protein [Pirellulales bacterium]
MIGIEAFLEILAGAGVKYIFGNPGTTELPLNDALGRDTRLQYILGLHEVPVLAMADGYAMASGQVGVCNVHIACGLGNSLGMLYNAWCEGTPLVLTAGQQDRRLRFAEPVLEGDLVRVASPWTKWSAEVQRAADIPSAVRRAVQVALTPPTGPVFLSLPIDVQLEALERPDLSPPCRIDRRVRPAVESVERAAAALTGARRPVILAGSRVTEAGGCAALARFAETWGAPVFAENTTAHGRLPIAADHPLYAGILPYWSPEVRARLEEFDVALAVGLNVLRLYIHQEPERPLPEHLRLVQIDCDAWQIGKNYPVEVGVWGDVRCALEEIHERLERTLSADDRAAAAARAASWGTRRAAAQESLRREMAAQPTISGALTPLQLMQALARVLPPDAAVVEESITTHQNVLERLGVFRDPTGHFAHRGWALGWGLGCALGVKLAWPDRPVVGLLGDGATLYGLQGLWTAARYRIPATFVVANNREYRILKVCGNVLQMPELARGERPGLDLDQPAIDFLGLARALGVEARRATTADELSDLVRDNLDGAGPLLIEAPVAR